MFVVRRSAAPVRQLLRQQPRRFESHAAHDHHHHGPVNESFGPSFYVAVSTFAAGFLLYRISKSSEDSFISRLITKYSPDQKIFEERNAIHTVALEEAAADRHLFVGQGHQEYVDLRSNEVFNTGSPFNVAPGSQADLNAIAAHYRKYNQDLEKDRVARTKDGKVVSVFD
ncbi:NADH-ubiquinone oxidoreductase 178 kDa subunit, putative [Talaromyces stipitatus ATCC 10500]|uniref:NADH-ubiquinone oxidoreductase 178 kDa subunit, putative n=1 Tax=Talaromyces stipitatus (strain ATCC 10500 / CBS 375.48 / QM 6759 / NRRL 1006) TaxID=441959 RepID=B8MDY1_TALSN|nr:NADH-ubiquinone oxidoreductase 178 kDa subunit, putative [Talaromyces stipitatus ATCC 10500]EED16058.1 NADH-ubiquinone oxidoreductase 178 kDa subunit, putative [Talaromyces stipitatus ATCC 10500]